VLTASGRLVLTGQDGFLTREGLEFFENFGVELGPSQRAFCCLCPEGDHLAGVVGRALASRCLDLGWVKRIPDDDRLIVTETGRHELVETFGLPVDWMADEGA
jgi:hypothetical protein